MDAPGLEARFLFERLRKRQALLVDLLKILLGLAFLYLGGEALVRGSVGLARWAGLSALFVGVVVVGFGTSVPELAVSLKAAFQGVPEITLGNVVGSNLANILLILSLASLIAPIRRVPPTAHRDGLIMVLASLLLLGLVQASTIPSAAGGGMLLLLGGYLSASYWLERRSNATPSGEGTGEEVLATPHHPAWATLSVVVGIALIVLGADALVTGAVSVARALGVSEAVIGLTMVAVGTSLPELATAVVAAYRRHPDVVLGNIIGSNIFNILGILGATALIQPLTVSRHFRVLDVPLMVGVSVGFWLLLLLLGRIPRALGALFLGTYLLYTVFLYLPGGR